MVEIKIVYEGQLHTTATHVPSSAKLSTDAPKDNEGKGESFSPTDLLATALGTCMVTTVGIVARRKNISLDGARVRVEKHMVTIPTRRVGKLVVQFDFPKGIPAGERKILEQTALACPVTKSLHPDIEIPLTFSYAD